MKNMTKKEKEELKKIKDNGYNYDYTMSLEERLKYKQMLSNFVETEIHEANLENLKKGETSLKISLLSRLNKIIRNVELIQLNFLEEGEELSENVLNNILFELAQLAFPISHASNLTTKIKVLDNIKSNKILTKKD